MACDFYFMRNSFGAQNLPVAIKVIEPYGKIVKS